MGSQPEAKFTSTSNSLREHSLSSQYCKNLDSEANFKPLLPDSIATANRLHATSQTEKTNEVIHQRHDDMGLRTVYQSRYPQIDCHPYFTRYSITKYF
ncbi:hypothetical protein TNCV_5066801 [Trichonephila clavipes]|nr:hypothetical protein TNCV_5066801 [Trichonephila clavipes]